MPTDAYLRRKYGITLADYEDMRDFQEGACAICRKVPKAADKDLAVDHNHVTGEVRGLLCGRCNHDLLGIFGDDPQFYMRAEEYLWTHPGPFAMGRRAYVPDSPGAEGIIPPNERSHS